MMLRTAQNRRKGQGLVEYGLLIAGVALICAAAVSIFGHKTSQLIAAVATILPGAHADDNAPIVTGQLIETTSGGATGNIALDVNRISTTARGTDRLSTNVRSVAGTGGTAGFGGL